MMPSEIKINVRFKILGSYYYLLQKGGEEIDEREEKTTIPVPSYSALKVLLVPSGTGSVLFIRRSLAVRCRCSVSDNYSTVL